jgi:uncharacterized protein YkwD
MRALITAVLAATISLSGCSPMVTTGDGASTGRAKIYRIGANDEARVQFRMLDAINALRGAAGLVPLDLNGSLNAAALTHSRDMSVQNRPWHFGSDGSSPLDRVIRAGYRGELKGENISETYETELETIGAWMEQPDTRRVIMDPRATDVGFGWKQDSNGKLWWTLITGGPA